MKNLLNPTPRQIKYRNELWAKALEENPKKARGAMRKSGGRCCLAVAEDVALNCGVEYIKFDNPNEFSINISKFFGWTLDVEENTLLVYKNEMINAVNLNDGVNNPCYNANIPQKGLSHKQIAKCVRDTFCK